MIARPRKPTFSSQAVSKLRAAGSDPDFRAYVRNNGGAAELLIMEPIGEDGFGAGVSATQVVAFLDDNHTREVNVRINSPGGFVFDGMVIYNALANHGRRVTVTIEGLAFSAASFIAMAGDHIRMHEASDIGIHRAAVLTYGNARVLRDAIEWLDKIDSQLIGLYSGRTGNSRKQIEQWLDGTFDGTLFSAEEAVKHGFADELIPGKQRNSRAKRTSNRGRSLSVAIAEQRLMRHRLARHRSAKPA